MRHRRILPFALTALTLACASAGRGGGLESVSTASAPAAIGPYSQAVVSRGVLYAAGQLPLDPVTGQLVAGDVAVQTERALMNLAAVLASRGAGWSDVTKTTLYLQDLKDFARVNEVYARVLGGARPARSTVQVAALPRGALIEIDLVAVVP
jgi:2-iminobutanoate/2-iminopropanoate deaminase